MTAATDLVRVTVDDGIAVIAIDNPPVNTSTAEVRHALLAAVTEVEATGARGAVLTGARGVFMSGSDVREFAGPISSPELPDVIAAIESSPVVFVAALDGLALGGGLELALACDARVGTPGLSVGLPELDWGILPGAGGIQRLVRAAGHAVALELILSSASIGGEKARAAGILDDVVPADELQARARELAATASVRPLVDVAVSEFDADEVSPIIEKYRRSRGDYPGLEPAVALALRVGATDARTELIEEREVFHSLRRASEAAALRHVRLAELQAPKVGGLRGVEPRSVASVGVVGAGAMGAGIARLFAVAGFATRIADVDAERAAAVAASAPGMTAVTLDGLAECELVLEAVVEDFDVKSRLFAQLEAICAPQTILASNTSYLDLDAMAEGLQNPERLIGLHFFNPPERMKLLEIVRTRSTADDVLAAAARLARSLGKTAIVTRVSDGFVANRMFAAYRREMEIVLQEGGYVDQIDAALVAAGFKMGPFAVADLSGLDIAWARRKRLAETRDPRERYVDIPDRLCESGRLGRKTGAGYYVYREGSSRGLVDPVVTAHVLRSASDAGITRRVVDADEIVGRALAALVNEAMLLHAEGIAQRAGDIDVAAVLGFGFPRHRGGPLWWSAERGADVHRRYLELVASSSGETFVAGDDIDGFFADVRG